MPALQTEHTESFPMDAMEYCVESEGEGVLWKKANMNCDKVFCFKEEVSKKV